MRNLVERVKGVIESVTSMDKDCPQMACLGRTGRGGFHYVDAAVRVDGRTYNVEIDWIREAIAIIHDLAVDYGIEPKHRFTGEKIELEHRFAPWLHFPDPAPIGPQSEAECAPSPTSTPMAEDK